MRGRLALTVMGLTVARRRGAAASAFSLFTKRRFADRRREMPGASHGAVMARLGEEWRHEKAAEEAPPLPPVPAAAAD